ncbi:methylmalonyl-CoA mutase family protein [Microvirga pudoricolor]|uniref:methylmalonyl-CoA mutase family protein n=1 Tax=Microvirga pudoricolor TaxID=2778729 RepID=UPI001951C545|nr:methylmalonyl-CoA mutase family protein [Microvirga pudoricolor]MBM6592544.1 methylmalonyl-CoA mutase small subunit [Microvirga pudoricolor]
MDTLPLAADFPDATREQWLGRVEGVLKGADFAKKLVGRTYDGIAIQPLYGKAENGVPTGRPCRGPWLVSQRVDHPDPAQAGELAILDLEGGANALSLVTAGAPAGYGFGVEIRSVDDLDRALSGVMLDLVHIRLDAGGHGRQVAALFVALAERRGHAPASLSVDFGLDPIGAMAAHGKLSASWEDVAWRCAETLAGLNDKGFTGRTFLADGRPYHAAGASEAQELAAVLATGLAYLRAFETGGHSLDAGRKGLAFLLVADADEFLTVAKFRALRRLWARVEEACGLEPLPLRLHAETAWRMTSRRDPWVNMLRTTVAAFSAGIGGADAVTVLPFTAALGLPDAFARRVARNTQLILLDEANLWRVSDPAAGAGGFEALTDELCEKAWGLFQEIEREGGIVASLSQGTIQDRIAAVRAARDKAIATRRDPITGTSEFPNIRETEVAVLLPATSGDARAPGPARKRPEGAASPLTGSGRPAAAVRAPFASLVADAAGGASLAELAATAPGPGPVAIAPLTAHRVPEPFERLRDRSDQVFKETGRRPAVFLANLGPVSAFTARSTFARNAFEAGGIEAITNEGFPSLEEMVEAYRESGARLACLCSSDEIYATQATSAAEALRRAGALAIYLAGRPGDREDELKAAGVSAFVFAGCDVLATLEEALRTAS